MDIEKSDLLKIMNSLSDRKCLLFIGSGLSKEAGLPDTDYICNVLLEKLNRDTIPKDGFNIQTIAEIYAEAYTTSELKKRIAEIIIDSLNSPSIDNGTYELISKLPHTDFITTNWDTLLEVSLKRCNGNAIFREDDLFTWANRKRNILKMHGCVYSPSTIIVTKNELLIYRARYPKFVDRILKLLEENFLILCGYSGSDFNFLQLLTEANDLKIKNGERARYFGFAIDPYMDDAKFEEYGRIKLKALKITARDFFQQLAREFEPDPNKIIRDMSRQIDGSRLGTDSIVSRDAVDVKRIEKKAHLPKILEIVGSKLLDRTMHLEGQIGKEELYEYDDFRQDLDVIDSRISRFIVTINKSIHTFSEEQLMLIRDQVYDIESVPTRISDMIEEKSSLIEEPELFRDITKNNFDKYTSFLRQLRIDIDNRIGKLRGGIHITDRSKEFLDVLGKLTSDREILRYMALLRIVREKELLQDYLIKDGDHDKKREIYAQLWENFHIVFLQSHVDRKRDNYAFIRYIANSKDNPFAEKIKFIISLFKDHTLNNNKLDETLRNNPDIDPIIALKCLTYHLGFDNSEDIRKYAISKLPPYALWEMLTLTFYPIFSTYLAAETIARLRKTDYKKILFDLKTDDLIRYIKFQKVLDDTHLYEKFILLFRNEAFVLEEEYYERINEYVREIYRVNQKGVLKEFSELYTILNSYRGAERKKADAPEEAIFNTLPKITKAKLSSNRLYLLYYIKNIDNEIALSVLKDKYIKDSELAASILRNPQINAQLLRTIANRDKLMSSYNAKKNLLFNTKAGINEWRKYGQYIRYRDLKQLAEDNDINPVIREEAKKIFKLKKSRS